MISDSVEADPARPYVTGGVLYVVGLPIGNSDDITVRALKVLAGVDVVLSEDTRRTRFLLKQFDINAELMRFDAHVEGGRSESIVELLAAGKSIALVSDAGTPCVSDPGHRLVRAVWDAGYRVVPIPGASSVIVGLSASGVGSNSFSFHGFLAKSQEARRDQLASFPAGTHVVFTPSRDLIAVMTDAASIPTIVRVVIGRELTKVHESVYLGAATEILLRLEGDPESALGESVVVFEVEAIAADESAVETALVEVLESGTSARDASRLLAERFGMPRKAIYQLALTLAARK